MVQNLIHVDGLIKRYGSFQALSGLTFSIPEGVIFGFVGPNGAGKTTCMRILATLMLPTAGTAMVDGEDVIKNPAEVRKRIGYMPDFFGVYDNLKVHEYLDFYGDAQGMDANKRKTAAAELLELVNLSDKAGVYVDTLSRGMKQRLCLARSLMHGPKLLILDEPASGMDPRARAEMKAILRTLKTMGKTILISSHILPELSELCDQVGIIQRGHMALSGTVDQIVAQMGGQAPVVVRFAGDAAKAAEYLTQLPQVGMIEQEEQVLRVGISGEDDAARALLSQLIEKGFRVVDFHREKSNLEQIFLEVTERGEAEQSGT